MTEVARFEPWESIGASTAYWQWSARVRDVWATRGAGAVAEIERAFGCAEGWLRVNADWVPLEPVATAQENVTGIRLPSSMK